MGDFDLHANMPAFSPAPSWDQSLDILDGFEQFMDATPNVPAASFAAQGFSSAPEVTADSSLDTPTRQLSSREVTKRNNRIAQKRFRERRKVKSQTLEAELAETKAQLEELKGRQKQLEVRNTLLEKVTQFNQQQPQPPIEDQDQALPDIRKDHGIEWASDPLIAQLSQVPSLTLTIWDDKEQSIPVKELGNMSLPEFAKLYSGYVRKLGTCLVDLSADNQNRDATQRLQKWVTEVNSIFAITCICKQSGLASFRRGKMDDATVLPDTLPSDAVYHEIMEAMDHSEEQKQDLMLVRRLFCAQMGQLARDREALLKKMLGVNCVDVNVLMYANDRLAQLTHSTKQLRNQAAAEFQMYLQLAAAFYRGIHTSRQLAAAMVHAYPHTPNYHLLERLAEDRGEPSMEQLAADTSVDRFQHAANWEQVETYLQKITMNNMHEYVPMTERTH